MLELELLLGGILIGIVLTAYFWPKQIKPRLQERWGNNDDKEGWPEHKPCRSCGSRTRHRQDCPENPKNRVKT